LDLLKKDLMQNQIDPANPTQKDIKAVVNKKVECVSSGDAVSSAIADHARQYQRLAKTELALLNK
jgi:hypothetical protein